MIKSYFLLFGLDLPSPSQFDRPGRWGLDYSPAWAVGLFFFPFLNLVSPYLVVREIWKASGFAAGRSTGDSWRSSPSSLLIPFWWATYLLMSLVGLVAVWRARSS
jgi:hypothetical protein